MAVRRPLKKFAATAGRAGCKLSRLRSKGVAFSASNDGVLSGVVAAASES